MKTAKDAIANNTMTARYAIGDNCMPEGVLLFQIIIGLVRMIRQSGAKRHAAIQAAADAGRITPIWMTTVPSRRYKVAARAGTDGILKRDMIDCFLLSMRPMKCLRRQSKTRPPA